MSWVRHDMTDAHRCQHRPPTSDGHLGDLWRCGECKKLWRIGKACYICDAYGSGPHPGQHAVGYKWWPATLWQRLRHWRNR